MSRLIVHFLLVACFVALATAQTDPPENSTELVSDKIERALQQAQCFVAQTRVVLGFHPTTRKPIYQNRCAGACLSLLSAPSECRPSYLDVEIIENPCDPNARPRRVKQINDCNCHLQRCRVRIGDSDTYYDHGAIAYDACDRRCVCRSGVLTDCCRQRKEFRLGLSLEEKRRYLAAVKMVSTDPRYKPQYDALIVKHSAQFGSGIHGGFLFFPWHRAYIWDLENLLRQVDCRVTVPYWRWSLEAANPFASTIWANSDSGFGGNGVPPGNCINTGPFAPPWQTSEAVPQCLRRNWILDATFATEADITQTLDVNCPQASQFACMASGIESYHNYVHNAVGGQMGGVSSASDPIFFMHHTYMDRVWARWQSKSAAHASAYVGERNISMPGLNTTVEHWLLLDRQNGNPAGRVCYIDPPSFWWMGPILSVPAVSGSSFTGLSFSKHHLMDTYPPYPNPDNGTGNGNGTGTGTETGNNSTGSPPQCVPASEDYNLNTNPYFNPLSSPCQTQQRLQNLPRIRLGPFPLSWFEAIGLSPEEIAEEQARFEARNNQTLYNLLDPTEVRNVTGLISALGFRLEEEDYRCIAPDPSDINIVSGERGLNYSDYDRQPLRV